MDDSRHVQWWEVRPGGQIGRLAAAPSATPDPARPAGSPDAVARAFGDRPLIAAVEDGWPLRDGTALVARDGALGRVRLSDGLLVETAGDAFPLRPARCHPVSLSRPSEPGRSASCAASLAVAPSSTGGTPPPLGWPSFGASTRPREVLASGNGGLAAARPVRLRRLRRRPPSGRSPGA